MLQQDEPTDYVVATGQNYSIKDFVDVAFKHVDIPFEIVDLHDLSNEEADKKVAELRKQKDKIFVVQHPQFYRPAEVNELLGDASKARKELNWQTDVGFEQLVKMMIDADLKEKQ
jgi:GDPmannose 4,6-dehydratase